jgi:hypothetical protein
VKLVLKAPLDKKAQQVNKDPRVPVEIQGNVVSAD